MLSTSRVIFSPRRAWIRIILILLACVLMLIGWIYSTRDAHSPKTLIVIDNSLSMTVQDIARDDGAGFVSRLDAAKELSSEVITRSGGEVAILSFAREPLLEMPFSQDIHLAKAILKNISPLVYGGGSDVFSALKMISHIYEHTPQLNILVLTDAEFFQKPERIPSLPASARLTFVGIGTERWGMMLQWYDADGKPRYREYQGKKAISALSGAALQELGQLFSAETHILTTLSDRAHTVEKLIASPLHHTVSLHPLIWLGASLLLVSVFFPLYIRTSYDS